MYGPWDAPLEFQETLLDEGDSSPLEDVIPPDFEFTQSEDPDTAFRYQSAYAAQVMVLDACWAPLMDIVTSASQAKPWLVVLTGVRGFPLGEHRRIGGVDQRLYGEQLHVPWIVRFPGCRGELARSHALTSHADLLPTIIESIDGGAKTQATDIDGKSVLPLMANGHTAWRDWLISANARGSTAIRTASWCLRQDAIIPPDGTEHMQPTTELYVRPDDRWEANDVAKLCPDVVEQLATAARRITQQLVEGAPMPADVVPVLSASC
jgi:arylsulfatase A-like enzyme